MSRQRRKLLKMLPSASSYESWNHIACELDALDGQEQWIAQDESTYFDAPMLRRHIIELRDAVDTSDWTRLESTLTESLYRNLPDVSAPPLYEATHSGRTKRVVYDWLRQCVDSMHALRDAEMPGISTQQRAARFRAANDNFGRTALLLSGGGAWGLYHLGVVKALKTHGLLPRVICGSSMGAIVAAGVGVRTDDELDELYADPGQIHRVAVRLLNPMQAFREQSLMSHEQLREHVTENVGMLTFGEAAERTGRILNVTISPTRARQKPRVLNARTAPDVLIADATIASCSIPGLFPPVALRAKTRSGALVPYAESELWVDGSMRGDLPTQRLARLHNVNHFVVSQANPFVLPFVIQRHHGPVRTAARVTGAIVRAQTSAMLDEVRKRVHSDTLRPILDTAQALTGQSYGGDINIHPRVPPTQYLKVMANPDLSELNAYILGGERATWPWLQMIADQTVIARELKACAEALEK
jgi:NTE family protein